MQGGARAGGVLGKMGNGGRPAGRPDGDGGGRRERSLIRSDRVYSNFESVCSLHRVRRIAGTPALVAIGVLSLNNEVLCMLL